MIKFHVHGVSVHPSRKLNKGNNIFYSNKIPNNSWAFTCARKNFMEGNKILSDLKIEKLGLYCSRSMSWCLQISMPLSCIYATYIQILFKATDTKRVGCILVHAIHCHIRMCCTLNWHAWSPYSLLSKEEES